MVGSRSYQDKLNLHCDSSDEVIYPNPRHLKAFVALAEVGSFSAAAAAVHIGQPALSQAIAGLEEMVGVRLIERTTRSVRLTPAGEEFLVDARRVLEANERLLARGTQWAQAYRGRIDLLAIPSVAHRLLPLLVKDFAKAYPEVRVEVHDHPDPVLRQRLERGEGDLAIMTPTQDGAGQPTLAFLRDHFRVLVASSHALAQQKFVDVRQLADAPLILLRRGALLRSYMDVAIGSLQLQHPPVEVDQIATLVGMVEAGLGVALLPAMGCPSPALRTVVNLPLRPASVHRLIAFALPAGRERMPVVQAFVRDALTSLAAHRGRLPPGCALLPVGTRKLSDFVGTTSSRGTGRP